MAYLKWDCIGVNENWYVVVGVKIRIIMLEIYNYVYFWGIYVIYLMYLERLSVFKEIGFRIFVLLVFIIVNNCK